MSNPKGTDPFPINEYDDFPLPLRRALARQGRAANALRVYRRRGWNQQAARHEWERARGEVERLLEQLELDELNPRLF